MIGIVGDTHGHLQLALCVLARWQEEMDAAFEAIVLCGDVGTFTCDEELDNATRAHAKRNPIELEFLTQWATAPQAPWLDYIFNRKEEGGLGLTCPVVMVHGNHEGFTRLQKIAPAEHSIPKEPLSPAALPGVDTNGHIKYLPSGWSIVLESGSVVAGIGGIERGQRGATYHPLAHIDDRAVEHLATSQRVDLLITHQGPSRMQAAPSGSPTLDLLLDAEVAAVWFHGHSIRDSSPSKGGPTGKTLVIPLEDIAFSGKEPGAGDPGEAGWAVVFDQDGETRPVRFTPAFLRDFRRHRWSETPNGLLVAPPLRDIAWRYIH